MQRLDLPLSQVCKGFLLLCCVCALAACDPKSRASEDDGVRNRGADKDNWWDALPRPEWGAFERIDDAQGWFEVYRLQPGVLAIYEPGQFEEVISYLILGTDRALLFDGALVVHRDLKAPPAAHRERDLVGVRLAPIRLRAVATDPCRQAPRLTARRRSATASTATISRSCLAAAAACAFGSWCCGELRTRPQNR